MVSFGQLSRRGFGDSDPASVAPALEAHRGDSGPGRHAWAGLSIGPQITSFRSLSRTGVETALAAEGAPHAVVRGPQDVGEVGDESLTRGS